MNQNWKQDSLSHKSKNFYRLLIFLIVACVCTGCSRQSSGGISSGTGGLPASPATPAEISSSAQVVKVITEPVRTSSGSSAEAIIKLAITSGYHVNANPATYSYLIATEIKLENSEEVTAGTATYPAGTKQKFEFAEEPLAVYEGNVEVKLPLKIGATAATGARNVPLTVRVQACDTEKCFPPATLNATIPVEVK
jgi:DsbC/DsbD-like thiol-disulfide interchange protein